MGAGSVVGMSVGDDVGGGGIPVSRGGPPLGAARLAVVAVACGAGLACPVGVSTGSEVSG